MKKCFFSLTRWIKFWKWFPERDVHSCSLPPWPKRLTVILLCSVLVVAGVASVPVMLTEHSTFLSSPSGLQVQKLQRAALKDPVKCAVSTKYSTVEKLQQYYIFIPSKYKVGYAEVHIIFCWYLLCLNITVLIFTDICIIALCLFCDRTVIWCPSWTSWLATHL